MLRRHIDAIEDEYYEDFLRAFIATKPFLRQVYMNKSLYKQKLLLSVSRSRDVHNRLVTRVDKFVVAAA